VLWRSLEQMWTKLGAEGARFSRMLRGQRMRSQEKPKSRLAANAAQCARCRKLMKVRILFPGRKVDDVTYKCEECGGEEMRSVPRVW
jgi:hypothetical protein